MTPPRWPIQWTSPTGPSHAAGPHAQPAPVLDGRTPDAKAILRVLERKKRLLARQPPARLTNALRRDLPFPGYFELSTRVSFHLDGLHATEAEVRAALARGGAARACRSRSAQRVRNHVA